VIAGVRHHYIAFILAVLEDETLIYPVLNKVYAGYMHVLY